MLAYLPLSPLPPTTSFSIEQLSPRVGLALEGRGLEHISLQLVYEVAVSGSVERLYCVGGGQLLLATNYELLQGLNSERRFDSDMVIHLSKLYLDSDL